MAQQELWECLYNHRQICEAIVHEGAEVAKMLLRQQAGRLAALSGAASASEAETVSIFLTSLNRSLYSYILFHLNLSASLCCFECRVHQHHVNEQSGVIAAGERIIDEYGRYLTESELSYQHVERACAYIQTHLASELTLSRVCAQLYVSRSYLCKAFRELTGTTLCDYVRRVRVHRARMLLVSTGLSIDEVADRCGFRSSTYFATVFRREMGISPSQFRRMYGRSARSGAILHAPGSAFGVDEQQLLPDAPRGSGGM